MRAAFDSNFIIYAEDMFADEKHVKALQIISQISADRILIPLQAAGEAMNWLVKKAKYTKSEAAESIGIWIRSYHTQATTLSIFHAANELAANHQFQIWDAIIMAAAAEAGSEILLTEDMQHGFKWQGVTIINPFAMNAHPLLQKFLEK
jgi:predicted nucleic acid-binding protein